MRRIRKTKEEQVVLKREFSPEARKRAAQSGAAMPGGGYPINTVQDLKNAIQAIGRAKNPAATRNHIRRRARALGRTDLIPESWKKKAAPPPEPAPVEWAIDTVALKDMLGREPTGTVLVDPDKGVCVVEDLYTFPLSRLLKTKVKMEDGAAFPPDAYAFSGGDPARWAVRLWETPTLRFTRKQALRAAADLIYHVPVGGDEEWEAGVNKVIAMFKTVDLPVPPLVEALAKIKHWNPQSAEDVLHATNALKPNPDWIRRGYSRLPVLKGEPAPFVLHAVCSGSPALQAEIQTPEDAERAIKVGAGHYALRLGSDVRFKGYWGMTLDRLPWETLKAVGHYIEGPRAWLDHTTPASAGVVVPINKDARVTQFMPVDHGDFYIIYATPTTVYLKMASDAKTLNGTYILNASEEGSYMSMSLLPDDHPRAGVIEMLSTLMEATAEIAEDAAESDDHMMTKALDAALGDAAKSGDDWLVWPKFDAEGRWAGHNIIDVVKTLTQSLEAKSVCKSDAAARFTLGVAYPTNDPDAHGDWITPKELERAAWKYTSSSRRVGLLHKSGTGGSGTVVESYIYRGPDWYDDNAILLAKSGDWLLGVIWDEDAWSAVETGKIIGYSMQGFAADTETEEE